MTFQTPARLALTAVLVLALAGCGGGIGGGLFGRGPAQPVSPERQAQLDNLNESFSPPR